jgi:hypothetical protein
MDVSQLWLLNHVVNYYKKAIFPFIFENWTKKIVRKFGSAALQALETVDSQICRYFGNPFELGKITRKVEYILPMSTFRVPNY